LQLQHGWVVAESVPQKHCVVQVVGTPKSIFFVSAQIVARFQIENCQTALKGIMVLRRAASMCRAVALASILVGTQSLAAGCLEIFPKSLRFGEVDACQVLAQADISYDPVQKVFFLSKLKNCGPVSLTVRYIAVRDHQRNALLLIYGNSCTSGIAGSDAAILENIQGKWINLLAVSAANSINVIETSRNGYRDLMIGGPGKCHSIFAWNGNKYVFRKKLCD
jgi:hypothetical protein